MLLQCKSGSKLTAMEKIAIDYINQNVEKIMGVPIADIAAQANVSAATVSRAIRKCGINRLTDLRYNIQKGYFVENDILDRAYVECKNTIENIDENSVLQVVDYIKHARRIHIVAKGMTRVVGKELEYRLRCLGYAASLYQDELIGQFDELVEKGDLVFLVTALNTDKGFLLQAAMGAKINGATTVACSCKKDATLEESSNVVVYGAYQDIPSKNEFKYSSRLGLHIVLQIIIKCLTLKYEEDN